MEGYALEACNYSCFQVISLVTYKFAQVVVLGPGFIRQTLRVRLEGSKTYLTVLVVLCATKLYQTVMTASCISVDRSNLILCIIQSYDGSENCLL